MNTFPVMTISAQKCISHKKIIPFHFIFSYISFSHVCVLSHFSHVQHFATPWTVAHQASLPMGFSRQEYWSGLLCLPPGHLPDTGIELVSLRSPALASGFFTISLYLFLPTTNEHTFVFTVFVDDYNMEFVTFI